MDWSKGFSATYYATVVDAPSWRDVERFEIIDGSISKSESGLRTSADLTCKDYTQTVEQWIRVWLDVRQDGDTQHIPLFTGLSTSPEREINGRLITIPLTCYSVLKPSQDVLLQRGWYAPAEISCERIIKNLLKVTPAPIEFGEGIPMLSQGIIAEDNESNLSMVEKILKAINWRMRITGSGIIQILPKASEISAQFDAFENDSIEPKVTVSEDWFNCPNVFRAINEDVSAVARDDNSDSPLSTVNRGREIWAEETDCDLADNESIAAYAIRRLKEAQKIAYTVSYDRRYIPDVEISDQIGLHYPEQNIDGVFEITSQTINLGYGCRTSEEVQKI